MKPKNPLAADFLKHARALLRGEPFVPRQRQAKGLREDFLRHAQEVEEEKDPEQDADQSH